MSKKTSAWSATGGPFIGTIAVNEAEVAACLMEQIDQRGYVETYQPAAIADFRHRLVGLGFVAYEGEGLETTWTLTPEGERWLANWRRNS